MTKQAKLDDEKEWWIPLAGLGEPFISRVASALISGLPLDALVGWETRYWMVYSALARGDANTARMYVNDWSRPRLRPSEVVSRFVPGDHYHAMGERFETLDEAIRHLRLKGRTYAGLKEVHVYAREGD